MKEDLIEELASIQHNIWSHWMKYLLAQTTKNVHVNKINPDGYIIPLEKVEKWSRQMTTKYEELSEQEKQSDRDQVMKFIHLIKTENIQNNKN